MQDGTFLSEELAALRRSGMLRSLRDIQGGAGTVVQIGQRPALMLCSNNYLGLADDARVKAAAVQAVEQYGTGATGSRLISGNSDLYAALEQELAQFKRTESALVFSSGYHANIGTIAALVGSGDAIYSDELNHASIIDGARLSRAAIHVYRHNDVEHLAQLLRQSAGPGRKLVITESVFSMDGDIAPLAAIFTQARKHRAVLMVDEAHGTGVFGENGSGQVEAQGLTGKVDVQMGTFSKALGSLGGYVAGSSQLIQFLLNRARSFIFSTGLPPAVLGASREAIRIVQSEPERRRCLFSHVAKLRAGLGQLGFALPASDSQIIPILIGDARRTMAACRYLLRHGIFVQGVRPPTVPAGTARLRLTPMSTHTEAQIEQVLQTFAALAALLRSPRRLSA